MHELAAREKISDLEIMWRTYAEWSTWTKMNKYMEDEGSDRGYTMRISNQRL